jgi:dUTP pyrophosphatase
LRSYYVLSVKLLSASARVPTIGHPGEDLGYDLYSAETVTILPKGNANISTGISVEYHLPHEDNLLFGFIIKEKSSYAVRRLVILGGVCDAGYRGELRVIMENLGDEPQTINEGDKVANLIPIPALANKVEVVSDLSPSLRGDGGFGSTGPS